MTFNKPPEWGKRFTFPENIQIEYNGYTGSVTSEIAVKMAERYEDAVVNQIAMEAKLAGVADCTVLNKDAILYALNKQNPKKVRKYFEVTYEAECPVCGGRIAAHASHRYCKWCGQRLEWSGDNE